METTFTNYKRTIDQIMEKLDLNERKRALKHLKYHVDVSGKIIKLNSKCEYCQIYLVSNKIISSHNKILNIRR